MHTNGEPKVKYRGIFINDEMPALGGWAGENYGGFTSGFYEHVFELILRLNGNYLWPAMWGRMFYVDDPKMDNLPMNTALWWEHRTMSPWPVRMQNGNIMAKAHGTFQEMPKT